MTPKKLTKQSEKIILAAVQDVVAGVQDGLKPTEAVIKVARDGDLSPNFIRLICTGYNRGATNFQRESSDSVLDKMAEFPLADADAAIAEIWRTEDKTAAVSDEYSSAVAPTNFFKNAARNKLLGQPLTKQADLSKRSSTEKETVKMSFDHAYRKVTALRRQALTKRSEYTMAQDTLLARLGALADSFKHEKQAAVEVHYAAKQHLGPQGAAVMQFVLDRNRQKSAAANKITSTGPIDWNKSPYRDVKECLAAARHMLDKKAEFHNFVDQAEKEAQDLMRPFCDTLVVSEEKNASILASQHPMTKVAFGSLIAGLGLGNLQRSLSSNLAGAEPARQAKIQSLTSDLEDPAHEQQLRKIKTQMMLTDLLNQDEALSGYDPSQVLAAYNELAQLSPRTATQPAFVRAYLRKNLAQGGPETFEAKELADVEKTLTDTQNPFKESPLNEQPFIGSHKAGSILQEQPDDSILAGQ